MIVRQFLLGRGAPAPAGSFGERSIDAGPVAAFGFDARAGEIRA
ncbi:hypothetical protein [Methylocystis sp.]|nr:hypothetical protein [Methylocystis sp.]